MALSNIAVSEAPIASFGTSPNVNVSLSSVTGTTNVGSVVPQAGASVDTTGVSTGALSVGNADAFPQTIVRPSGIGLISSLDQDQVLAFTDVSLSVSGEESTTSLGEESVELSISALVTGFEMSSFLGFVSAPAAGELTGVESFGQVGSATVGAGSFVSLTGQESTASLGSVTAFAGSTVVLSGFSTLARVGSVSFSSSTSVALTGVQGDVELKNVNVWGRIVPNQTPDWDEVVPTQSPSWGEVSPNQSPNWRNIQGAA